MINSIFKIVGRFLRAILRAFKEVCCAVKRYPEALYKAPKFRNLFSEVNTFVGFVGYDRSGHSIIGALLDAHPNIIIAHELDALKYVLAGFNRDQIYWLLLENSRVAALGGRVSGGYSYFVPGQWQGKFEKIKVIGDKRGSDAAYWLTRAPWLLKRLRSIIRVRVKFIHVVRNPYDNITTIHLKSPQKWPLGEAIDYYFWLFKAIQNFKKRMAPADFYEVQHEWFVAHPRDVLKEICLFLGVEAPEDYLNACAAIVSDAPHKSRLDMTWPPELIEKVTNKIKESSFLHGYTYEN